MNMKRFHSFILPLLMLCLLTTGACTSSSDNSGRTVYNNTSVTVAGNDFDGYRLYTDFDVILNPTNINQLPQLKAVRRALISFTLEDESLTSEDLIAGRTYNIVLNTADCYEIPTFAINVDTLSNAYQAHGQDSIALKKQLVQSVSQASGLFYVKNGYLNATATFGYSNTRPVCFALYYDGEKDIDTANKTITVNLYYNSGVTTPTGTVTSPLSFRISPDIYADFLDAGVRNDEQIDIYLKAATVGGTPQLHYQMKLSDLLLP